MRYRTDLSRKARKELAKLPHSMQQRIIKALLRLENDLTGDIKRLAAHQHEYRLRVGNYRVLFDLEDDIIVVKRIEHRQGSYRS